jgi:hypothetical protein
MPKEHRRPFPARASPGRTTYSELRQGRLLGRFFWACRGKCQKARGHRGERSILARRTSKAICPHCDAMPPCRLRETPCVVEHPKPPQSKQARLSEGQLDEAQTGGREDKEEEEGGGGVPGQDYAWGWGLWGARDLPWGQQAGDLRQANGRQETKRVGNFGETCFFRCLLLRFRLEAHTHHHHHDRLLMVSYSGRREGRGV